MRAALARRPGDATALTYLNIARAKQGDLAGALKALDRAAKDSTSTAPHYGPSASWPTAAMDLARAAAELRQATDRNTEAFRARALLGKVLLEQGKADEALPLLEGVSHDAPSLNEVHATLGRIYLSLGRDREARDELKQLVDANHAGAEDWALLTEATLGLGLTTEADQALTDAGKAGATPARLAQLRLVDQSWKGPKEALTAAKLLDKDRKGPAANDARLALWTGDAWRRGGDYKHAEDTYRAALTADPLHANLGLGKVALLQNQGPAAEGSYRAAIAALASKQYGKDDQVDAHLGLARALLLRKAGAEAIAELEKAIAADPAAPEPHFWLARTQADKGQTEIAIAEAARATDLDDQYADAFVLLGDLTRKNPSSKERAKKAYKRYLGFKPDGPDAKNAKRQLAALK